MAIPRKRSVRLESSPTRAATARAQYKKRLRVGGLSPPPFLAATPMKPRLRSSAIKEPAIGVVGSGEKAGIKDEAPTPSTNRNPPRRGKKTEPSYEEQETPCINRGKGKGKARIPGPVPAPTTKPPRNIENLLLASGRDTKSRSPLPPVTPANTITPTLPMRPSRSRSSRASLTSATVPPAIARELKNLDLPKPAHGRTNRSNPSITSGIHRPRTRSFTATTRPVNVTPTATAKPPPVTSKPSRSSIRTHGAGVHKQQKKEPQKALGKQVRFALAHSSSPTWVRDSLFETHGGERSANHAPAVAAPGKLFLWGVQILPEQHKGKKDMDSAPQQEEPEGVVEQSNRTNTADGVPQNQQSDPEDEDLTEEDIEENVIMKSGLELDLGPEPEVSQDEDETDEDLDEQIEEDWREEYFKDEDMEEEEFTSKLK